jgi:hypothetical protein
MARDKAGPDRVQGSQLEIIRLGGTATLRTDFRGRAPEDVAGIGIEYIAVAAVIFPQSPSADEMVDFGHIHRP